MPPKRPPSNPTPLSLTRELLDVSVTERMQFLSCRRKWFLETIENLSTKAPGLAFDFGTGMHAGLEALYLGQGTGAKDPVEDAHAAIDKWYKVTDKKYVEQQQPMEVQDELFNLGKLGHVMLDNYLKYDETAKITLGEVLAVEGRGAKTGKELKFTNPEGYPPAATPIRHPSGRILVPIVNPLTREPVTREFNGKKVIAHLTARIDLLTRRATPKKGLWVVDHKTANKAPNTRGLEFDDQVTGYCYVVYRMLAKIPRGVVFNYLIKDQPKEPRVGKKGDLSYAQGQRTTPDMYREALKDHGMIKRGKIESEKHAQCLASLLAHGWDRFFQRHEPTRNEHQMHSYEERLFFEYLDMEEALENHELLYPNLSTWNCPGCAVAPICWAMEDGSDYQDIIDNQFVIGEDRKA